MRIYVASSWRNNIQPSVVAALRADGHEVYDFKNPYPGNEGFHWSEIDPKWKEWTPDAYVEHLESRIAQTGFDRDMQALATCDACVLVLPCGRSAHIEAGHAAGSRKRVLILLHEDKFEPELMYKMADWIGTDIEDLRHELRCDSQFEAYGPNGWILNGER